MVTPYDGPCDRHHSTAATTSTALSAANLGPHTAQAHGLWQRCTDRRDHLASPSTPALSTTSTMCDPYASRLPQSRTDLGTHGRTRSARSKRPASLPCQQFSFCFQGGPAALTEAEGLCPRASPSPGTAEPPPDRETSTSSGLWAAGPRVGTTDTPPRAQEPSDERISAGGGPPPCSRATASRHEGER